MFKKKMNYKYRIVLLIILLISAFDGSADTYKILAIKNCNPTYNGESVKVGMRVSDPLLLKENWNSDNGSKYITLLNESDNSTHVITERKNNRKAEDNENFLSWLWSCFTGQKKCSTRAPENELSGGLADNLSQTFYLLMSSNPAEIYSFSFASNLKEGSKLHCSHIFHENCYEFDVPLRNNKFTFTNHLFTITDIPTDRVELRLNVVLIGDDGVSIPITNSMNVILIPE